MAAKKKKKVEQTVKKHDRLQHEMVVEVRGYTRMVKPKKAKKSKKGKGKKK